MKPRIKTVPKLDSLFSVSKEVNYPFDRSRSNPKPSKLGDESMIVH